MTNAELNTLINTIDTGGVNPAIEVRDVLQGIKGEMFQTSHLQEVASNGNNFNYTILYNKIGNICFVNGTIRNETSTILTDYNILIDNSIFYPKTNTANVIQMREDYSLVVFSQFLSLSNILTIGRYINNTLDISTGLPVGSSFSFNGFYKIND